MSDDLTRYKALLFALRLIIPRSLAIRRDIPFARNEIGVSRRAEQIAAKSSPQLFGTVFFTMFTAPIGVREEELDPEKELISDLVQ